MDSIDAQLLRILAEDARCSATDISKKVITLREMSIHTGSQQTDFQVARKRHNRAIHDSIESTKD